MSYGNWTAMLITPVTMAAFIQVNKTAKSLTRYHPIMSKKEIAIIKFDQMDMMEIRKQLLRTRGGQINKDVYARLILLCVGSDEAEQLGPQSYSNQVSFPSSHLSSMQFRSHYFNLGVHPSD